MLVRFLATWFGAGLSPKAPGTVGTLATVPLAILLGFGPPIALPLAALLVTAVGVWAANAHARARGLKDPQEIVIDEAAGFLLACCFGPFGWPTLLAAFALFRFFDILKPWPVSALEALPGGWGIMMDDVAAGLMAGVVILLGWGLAASHWTGFLP